LTKVKLLFMPAFSTVSLFSNKTRHFYVCVTPVIDKRAAADSLQFTIDY